VIPPSSLQPFEQTLPQFSTPETDEDAHLWYLHWAGLARQLEGKNEDALTAFIEASNNRTELGRPNIERDKLFKSKSKDKPGSQAIRPCKWYANKRKKVFEALDYVRDNLKYGSETKKAEEAVKLLGFLLGLEADRPDNTKKTGPDVIWWAGGEPFGISFELKTNKKKDGENAGYWAANGGGNGVSEGRKGVFARF